MPDTTNGNSHTASGGANTTTAAAHGPAPSNNDSTDKAAAFHGCECPSRARTPPIINGPNQHAPETNAATSHKKSTFTQPES